MSKKKRRFKQTTLDTLPLAVRMQLANTLKLNPTGTAGTAAIAYKEETCDFIDNINEKIHSFKQLISTNLPKKLNFINFSSNTSSTESKTTESKTNESVNSESPQFDDTGPSPVIPCTPSKTVNPENAPEKNLELESKPKLDSKPINTETLIPSKKSNNQSIEEKSNLNFFAPVENLDEFKIPGITDEELICFDYTILRYSEKDITRILNSIIQHNKNARFVIFQTDNRYLNKLKDRIKANNKTKQKIQHLLNYIAESDKVLKCNMERDHLFKICKANNIKICTAKFSSMIYAKYNGVENYVNVIQKEKTPNPFKGCGILGLDSSVCIEKSDKLRKEFIKFSSLHLSKLQIYECFYKQRQEWFNGTARIIGKNFVFQVIALYAQIDPLPEDTSERYIDDEKIAYYYSKLGPDVTFYTGDSGCKGSCDFFNVKSVLYKVSNVIYTNFLTDKQEIDMSYFTNYPKDEIPSPTDELRNLNETFNFSSNFYVWKNKIVTRHKHKVEINIISNDNKVSTFEIGKASQPTIHPVLKNRTIPSKNVKYISILHKSSGYIVLCKLNSEISGRFTTIFNGTVARAAYSYPDEIDALGFRI